MLETVAQAVINGLLIGGIYALVSIGVTLIFGVVKIVNFAQGEFVMIGMYISVLSGHPVRHRSAASRCSSRCRCCSSLGVLIQHFLIRRVLGPNDMPQIFLTFALSLLLLNLVADAVHRRITAPFTPPIRMKRSTSAGSISPSRN